MIRIPTSRLYRAFPELDRFSDEQCEALMYRVKIHTHHGTKVFFACLAAVIVMCPMSYVLMTWLEGVAWNFGYAIRYEAAIIAAALFAVFGMPTFGALIARDLVLRRSLLRAIKLRLEQAACRHCGYLLLGLTVDNGMVRCPECGTIVAVAALGLNEKDLLPTDVDDGIGEIRADPYDT